MDSHVPLTTAIRGAVIADDLSTLTNIVQALRHRMGEEEEDRLAQYVARTSLSGCQESRTSLRQALLSFQRHNATNRSETCNPNEPLTIQGEVLDMGVLNAVHPFVLLSTILLVVVREARDASILSAMLSPQHRILHRRQILLQPLLFQGVVAPLELISIADRGNGKSILHFAVDRVARNVEAAQMLMRVQWAHITGHTVQTPVPCVAIMQCVLEALAGELDCLSSMANWNQSIEPHRVLIIDENSSSTINSPLGYLCESCIPSFSAASDELSPQLRAAELLLAHGASLNGCERDEALTFPVGSPYCINKAEASALHLAVKRGNIPLAMLLLDHGADVNALDQNGRTPLHYVAEFNVTTAIDMLLLNGADHTIADSSGRRCLAHALFVGSGLAANALNRKCGYDAPEKRVIPHSVRHL